MALELLPKFVQDHYEIHEWKHPISILVNDFPNEYKDIIDVLTNFRLYRSAILTPGGGKSPIASTLDKDFYSKGWVEKSFDTKIIVDEDERETPTHKVDCYKNRVALDPVFNPL